MSDRPASLAAVVSAIEDFAMDFHDRRQLVMEIEALPTYAPATPDAPKSVGEMADAIGAERTAPTKPPRERPTPQPGMVVALVSGAEFYIPHNQYTTWRSVVSSLAPAVLRASESSIVRIYWPGPTPVVIWERA